MVSQFGAKSQGHSLVMIMQIQLKGNFSLESGDIIFVPYDLEVNKWTRFKDWMTVIGQVAAFIVLIQNIAVAGS